MLTKRPTGGFFNTGKKLLKIGIALEVLGLGATYFVWHRMNTSQDFRHYIHRNFPSVLNQFYNFTELMDSTNAVRTTDFQAWQKEGKAI